MPEETFYVEGIQIAKRGIAMDIQKFVPELVETRFVETFKAEPKPAPTAPAPAPAAPAVTQKQNQRQKQNLQKRKTCKSPQSSKNC